MKRFVISVSLLVVFSAAFAQNKLDLTSQAMQRRAKMAEAIPEKSRIRTLQYDKVLPPVRQPMIAMVKLNDGANIDELVKDGFEVKELRGGFAVVTCSPDDANRLASHRTINKCEFNRERRLKMDVAREISGVNTIHKGIGLPQTFTGKGVITAIADAGFDPNHINFKDAEGNSRFEYFSTVEINTTGSGIRNTPYFDEALASFTTDDNTQTHGTHTLGIMAGSFRGEATVANYDSITKTVTVGTMNNPYYGVAYDSKLYASSGASHDALIAYAVDGMLEHRWNSVEDHYTPIVINLSLGGNQGPHDGTGILTEYLDFVAIQDNAIICIAAGNEGNMPIAYHKTFTEEDNSFGTFIRPYTYSNLRYGIVELYSDTDEDFDVSVIIYNKARGRVARTFPLNNKEGQIQYICSDEAYQQDASDIIDATFAKAYEGYVGVGGMHDEKTGRFYAAIDYYVVNNDDENPADETTTEAQYTLGFVVTGKAGQRVDAYCDGMLTALDSYGYEGYVDGMNNGSVSDVATGKHTIVVGAYTTKEWSAGIMGDPLGYDGYYKAGEVTDYSSFGTLADGRNLPHLVAPGCLIVSSLSTPYFKNRNNGVTVQLLTVKTNDGKRDHYFYPMMGTSMASPFVAGTVALMCEADPTLNYEKVRDILMMTATKDDAFDKVSDPVQIGAGKLNALAALKEALNQASIETITGDETKRMLFIPTGERTFNVYLAGAKSLNVAIRNLAGATVLKTFATGNEAEIDASTLTPGIYIITINGANAQKVVVK